MTFQSFHRWYRFVILGFIGLFALWPVASSVFGTSFLTFLSDGGFSTQEFDRHAIERNVRSRDLTNGTTVDNLLSRARALGHARAPADDASTFNKTLTVAVVHVTSSADRHGLDLDFSEAGKSALLVVADRALTLTSSTARSSMRAKFAVESQAVFSLDGVPRGLLAGFRVRPFGAYDVAGAADAETDSGTRRFCNALKFWVRHYGVAADNVRVWHVTDPSEIRVVGSGLNAQAAKVARPYYAAEHCR